MSDPTAKRVPTPIGGSPTAKQLRHLSGLLERAPSFDLKRHLIRVSASKSRELPDYLLKTFGGACYQYGKQLQGAPKGDTVGARWELRGFEAIALVQALLRGRHIKLHTSRVAARAFGTIDARVPQ